ncbi:MAG: peptidoglycan-binding protein [Cyanothece sp. SIO2G6]|nr:peptidoglycan-binding protein [Cyanothece sp. SIO2G6]
MDTAIREGSTLKALARFKMFHDDGNKMHEVTEEPEAEQPLIIAKAALNPNEDLLSATRKHTELVKDYVRLASQPTLSDDDIEEMDRILEIAESDSTLSFLIGEADYLVGQRMGLFNPDDPDAFADEQAWLREHLETSRNFSPAYTQEFQRLLQEKGLYTGEVDGILGEQTAAAILRFQKQHNLLIDGVPGMQTFTALWTGGDYHCELQSLLKEKGYYAGAIDGILGIESRAALLKFQISHDDVKADGFPGPNTYLALKAHSEYCYQVQEMLRTLGFYSKTLDGVIGQKTRQALRQFQASIGLIVDGIPGESTYLALKKAIA